MLGLDGMDRADGIEANDGEENFEGLREEWDAVVEASSGIVSFHAGSRR